MLPYIHFSEDQIFSLPIEALRIPAVPPHFFFWHPDYFVNQKSLTRRIFDSEDGEIKAQQCQTKRSNGSGQGIGKGTTVHFQGQVTLYFDLCTKLLGGLFTTAAFVPG